MAKDTSSGSSKGGKGQGAARPAPGTVGGTPLGFNGAFPLGVPGPITPAPAPAAAPVPSDLIGLIAPEVGPAPARGPANPTVLPMPQSLGGLDLGALASQSMAETDRRIAGQGSLMDAYLDQVLSLNSAGNDADAERQQRMLAFRRQQALLQEQTQRQRMSQNEALQRARIEAAASEGLKDRDFRAAMSAEERAFELGQAAVAREETDLRNRLLELQVQQMEQELGGGQSGNWGRGVAAAERGAELSQGRQNELRNTTFTDVEEGRSKVLGVELPRIGPDPFGFRGPDTQKVTTYDDLMGTAEGYMQQYGEDPNEMVRRIKELARNRPQLASLLLHDIGYNPGAFLAPEG